MSRSNSIVAGHRQKMATFTGQAATNNTFTGTAGGDLFLWSVPDINSLDRALGAGGRDVFKLTNAGALAPTALAGVAGIERIVLAAGGNGLTLTNANFAGVAGAKIIVTGGAAGDTVDASKLTGANAIDVTAGAGNDRLTGGAGRDVFRFVPTNLSGDTVLGGGGRDLLLLTGAGSVSAGGLSGMAGVETIQLAAGSNAITLVNGNLAGVAGARIVVRGGAGTDAVDGQGLTGANAVDVTAGAGTDVLRGGAGRDVFRFTAANLAGDTVLGGLGLDTLLLTSAGALGAGGLNGMSGVEAIKLSSGGNTLALVDANFGGVAGAKIVLAGSAGADSINGSGLTGTNAIDVTAGLGADVLRGGAGRDTFRFTAQGLAGDTVNGGSGPLAIDTLMITTAGKLANGALANVTDIDRILLAAGGNTIVLTEANVPLSNLAVGTIEVIGGAGNDSVDGSAITGINSVLLFTAGAGRDRVIGGAGIDTFRFAAADLKASDTIIGGGGGDDLTLTTSGPLAADALAGMTGVESINLANGANTLNLRDANFTGLDFANFPTILVKGGSGNDTINASTLTGTNAIAVTAGAGLDVLRGGAGADRFLFAAANLNGDTISGGEGFDRLDLTTARVLGASALAGMTSVELIALASGTNGLILQDANFVGTTGQINLIGNSGSDTIDASGVAVATNRIQVVAGAGNDTLKGGAGGDTFQFVATDLTAGDAIAGGAGYDTLLIVRPLNAADGTLATDALEQMTGIDQIQLGKTGTGLTLTDANYAVPVTGDVPGSDRIDIYGTTGASVIDAADLTGTHAIYFYDGNGSDTVIGGAGDDVVRYEFFTAAVPGDTFDGGGGVDAIMFQQSMDFLGDTITNVEELIYFNTTNSDAAVTISGKNAARIGQIGSDFQDGKSAVFTVQLAANSNTDLSNLTLVKADAGDAIKVVSSGGATQVFLSSSISSFTGSTDTDDVFDYSTGGAQAIATGGGADTIFYVDGFVHEAGDTVDGGTGDDTVVVDRSMNFLGNSLVNVERLGLLVGAGELTLRISGESAAGLKHVGSASGLTEIYSIELSAGSATDLSNITLDNPDAGDAIKVVATSGDTAVTLNDQIASFTGSADADTVGYAVGGGYKDGAVIDGGGGDDRIVHSFGVAIDAGTGNDTLVLLTQLNFVTRVRLMNINQVVGSSNIISNFENVDASGVTISGVELNGRGDVVSVLIGSAQGDTITAGAAGAVITGGLGADTLTGGTGGDRFLIRSTEEAADDMIEADTGDDGIDVLGSADLRGVAISGIETLFLAAGDGAGNFTADDLTATVTGAQAAALTDVFGNGYNTTSVETLVVKADTTSLDLSGLAFYYFDGPDHVEITGTVGDDTIIGSSTNDIIRGNSGLDVIAGEAGNDTIAWQTFTQTIDGGTGTDTILFEDQLDASQATLRIDLSGNSVQHLFAGDILENTTATNFENVDLSAISAGADILGSAGDNVLTGGSAGDMITGGFGADTLTGNGGADSFVWNSVPEGGDTITDFTRGTDKLVFSGTAFAVDFSFDTVAFNARGFTGDITGFDLLLLVGDVFNSATEVRAYLDTQQTTADHGMFLVANNSQGSLELYYTANATAGGANNAVFEIADLGAGAFPDLNDFVFM